MSKNNVFSERIAIIWNKWIDGKKLHPRVIQEAKADVIVEFAS